MTRGLLSRLLLVGSLGLAGCSGGPSAERTTPPPGAPTATPEGSLYELTFPLTDQDGRTRHLAEFRGEPFVASMVYTSCTSVCPRVTADLKEFDRTLAADRESQLRFILFSLDPERDTPAAMRDFAARHHVDPRRWTLLAAGPDDMRTLAAVLDVRFRPDEGGEIAHSAVIAIVDSGGVIRHRQVGTSSDRAGLVAAVRAVH